jgi:endogenous inhibitor of DNA gyrase (YacG/DUF329 family)
MRQEEKVYYCPECDTVMEKQKKKRRWFCPNEKCKLIYWTPWTGEKVYAAVV